METYINNNVIDITYMSELTPLLAFARKQGGLIRPNNLRSFHSVSCGLIKCLK